LFGGRGAVINLLELGLKVGGGCVDL
jgi:hypothetical protein